MSRMRAHGRGRRASGGGLMTASASFPPRGVWWNFRLMGKTDVAVLDGGFPKWQAEGRPVEDMPPMLRDRHMTAQRQAHLVKGCDPGRLRLQAGRLADPRCPQPLALQGRGTRGAPRPAVGAYPGFDQRALRATPPERGRHDETGRRAPRRVRGRRRRRQRKRTITSCGSGVTAAIVMPGAGAAGQSRRVSLRRIVVRMGAVRAAQGRNGMTVIPAGTEVSFRITYLEMPPKTPGLNAPGLPGGVKLEHAETPPRLVLPHGCTTLSGAIYEWRDLVRSGRARPSNARRVRVGLVG